MSKLARPLILVAFASLILVSCGTTSRTTSLSPTSPSVKATAAAPANPTATIAATCTATPGTKFASTLVMVANTGGEGVYIRRTPSGEDKIKAYPDGTIMLIIGNDAQAGGNLWANVRASDGTQGWAPAEYLVLAPVASPTASAPTPAKPTWTPVPKPIPIATPVPRAGGAPAPSACCKICTTGKACGDSCISRNYTCRQPRGCACDG